MRRVVAIVVVLALHAGWVAMFATSRIARRDEALDEPRMTVVLLSLDRSPAASSIAQPEVVLIPPLLDESTAITAPPLDDVGSGAPPEAPPRIDWADESRLAASRAAESLEEQRRRDAVFAGPETSPGLKKPPPPGPEFAWSRAHTQRIEALPEGGTLIRLNDRCALVLYVGLFPVCSLGKIEARGDLFDHMRDPPRAPQ